MSSALEGGAAGPIDWRRAFDADSRASFDSAIGDSIDPDLFAVAGQYRAAWRYDNSLADARSLENYFASTRHVSDYSPDGNAEDLDELASLAMESLVSATRRILASAGVSRLRLYRGQRADTGWNRGDDVQVRGRGLTPWTPDRPIAYAYAARNIPGAVLVADVDVTAVAMAFDPSSDGEVVLLGVIEATVSTLVS